MPKTSTMSASFFSGLVAHLSLLVLILATIQSIEARRRLHKDDDSDGHTNRESDCDSDFRTTNTNQSETHKWPGRRPATSSPRIINGRRVKLGDYPFVVRIEIALKRGKKGTCTGSIIDSKTVLTAAHCVLEYKQESVLRDPATIRVVAGDHRRDMDGDRAVSYKPKLIAVHKLYRLASDYTLFDIALIVTRDYIKVDKGDAQGYGKVDTVELPPREGLPAKPGQNVTVAGWGKIDPDDSKSDAVQLMAFDTKPVACSDPRVPYVVNREYICVPNDRQHGPCHGDSGGPLFVQPPPDEKGRKQKPVLYGITNFIPGGRCIKAMSYFLNLSQYTTWINEVLTNPNFKEVVIAINKEP